MITRISVTAWLLLQAATAHASLPFPTGESSSPECVGAMALAEEMFQSTAQRLYAPLKVPTDLGSRLVLGASVLDLSGGNALISGDEFEKLSHGLRSIYWAKDTNDTLRVVIREIPVGWRGDMYDLYLVDSAVAKEDFISGISSTDSSAAYQPLVENTWRPPLVFQHNDQKANWLIDVGQPFQILHDWRVFSSRNQRAICTIHFSPAGQDATAALPLSVTRLTRQLDEALGPGNDEGTLQQTARIRLHTRHVLANAAYRPWSIADSDAYNSRSEIDAGLADWAEVNSSRRRLYSQMLDNYPAAELSLARYYQKSYGLQPQQARQVAAWVLDVIFRSYFVFPKRQNSPHNNEARANPWPLER